MLFNRVEESQAAQGKSDFIYKMSIVHPVKFLKMRTSFHGASKESRETLYWLKLLNDSGYIQNYSNKDTLFKEINSIINILTKIIKTLTENKNDQ